MSFSKVLKDNGWAEEKPKVLYTKGSWEVLYDTSSWMQISTKQTPRVFDVPVPQPDREQWTMNLIKHLCETDDLLKSK